MRTYAKEADAIHEAVGNAIRGQMLAYMSKKPGTAQFPREIADGIDQSLGSVAYHMRKLQSLGMVTMTRTRPVRGAVAHYYKLTARGKRTAEVATRLVNYIEEAQ